MSCKRTSIKDPTKGRELSIKLDRKFPLVVIDWFVGCGLRTGRDESKNAYNSGLAAHIVDVIFPEFERALIPVSCFKLDWITWFDVLILSITT